MKTHPDVEFISQFKNDHKTWLKSKEKLLIPADKTTNLYRMDAPTHNHLRYRHNKNATKKHQATLQTPYIISAEKKDCPETHATLTELTQLTKKIPKTLITLKDHKPNFKNNPTCRLINPAKSEMGRISKQYCKHIIQKINAKVTY